MLLLQLIAISLVVARNTKLTDHVNIEHRARQLLAQDVDFPVVSSNSCHQHACHNTYSASSDGTHLVEI